MRSRWSTLAAVLVGAFLLVVATLFALVRSGCAN